MVLARKSDAAVAKRTAPGEQLLEPSRAAAVGGLRSDIGYATTIFDIRRATSARTTGATSVP